MQTSDLTRFVIRVLLWLPALFAVWYYLAVALTWPVTFMVRSLLMLLYPETINDVQQLGYQIQAFVGVVFPPGALAPDSPRRVAELILEVNPLSYGYSLPLYTALLVATPGEEGEKWFNWGVGLVILLVVQSLGVCMNLLKSLFFYTTPEIMQALALVQWQKEAVALGYQFTYLILPSVTPIMVWMALHLGFLKKLAPNLDLQAR